MAIEVVLFIDENFVKTNSQIDENVDAQLIRNAIREAQDLHIHPILGTGLYNELKSQISAGTLTALNTTLKDTYISWALLYYTLYEGADILTFKWRNKGIMKTGSENTEVVNTYEIERLMDRVKDKAEWYSQRVTKYLRENSASYPLFDNAGNGIDIIHPKTDNFTTGWVLGEDSGDCDCEEFRI